jgi:predicted amidohydrolase YtcJ
VADPDPTILYQTIAKLPPLSADDQVNSTLHFYRELNRFGLTSAIDAGGGGHQFPGDYRATDTLASQRELSLRISYYLFPQRPGRELEDLQTWIRDYKPGTNGDRLRSNGYVLEGSGEFLVWSAGDFENFQARRPDLDERPGWRDQLTAVTRTLVQQGWPLRIHATYDQTISKILGVFEDGITSGQYADFAVLSDDYFSVPAETIRHIESMLTVVGGTVVYGAGPFAGLAEPLPPVSPAWSPVVWYGGYVRNSP